MLAYRHPSNGSEQYLLPSLDSAAPVVQSFTCGPDFSDLDYADGLLPAIDNSQYAYYPQNDYFRSLSEMPQSSRTNLQMNPFAGSMEPYFVYPQGAFPPQSQAQFTSSMYSMTMAPEMMSHTTPSAINPGMMSFKTMHDEYYTTPTWQQNLPIFAPQDYDQATSTDDGMDGPDGSDELDEDETTNYDKPYAQLIYEALMQAPGHRMLLRDIYDWFIANTRKPRESGTNGWQNSIRHNLSMNQAFENDKNDPAVSRGTKKANSVWVLTEHAIKHGVQSTTRYRKNGTSKKTSSNRTPAIQRQQSGAKGGRAARRAARAKRHDCQQTYRPQYSGFNSPLSYSHTPSPLPTSRDQWSTYGDSPITPSEDSFPLMSYTLPHRSYCNFDPNEDSKAIMEGTFENEEQIRQLLSVAEHGFGSNSMERHGTLDTERADQS